MNRFLIFVLLGVLTSPGWAKTSPKTPPKAFISAQVLLLSSYVKDHPRVQVRALLAPVKTQLASKKLNTRCHSLKIQCTLVPDFNNPTLLILNITGPKPPVDKFLTWLRPQVSKYTTKIHQKINKLPTANQ